jgi:DNA polymerase-3 subunit delta
MTPTQLLARLEQRGAAPAYLFLGPEAYHRQRARAAVRKAAIGEEGGESAVTRYDLNETALAEVIDDARALSLFASERIIFAGNAEAALPRTRSDEDAEDGEGGGGSADVLSAYMKDPTPGVVLVFDAPRFDFEGEDKRKQERVRKFYSAVGEAVEFKRASADEARREAVELAKRIGLRMDREMVDLLVEALAADLTRIGVEVEKLALYAGGRPVTAEDMALMIPDARATTIFALVSALGRRDRTQSLAILDTLFREGEYLPLALSFLAAQFRAALVAKEAGLRSPQQVQGHFAKMGVPMWGSRAEQVFQTVGKFSRAHLERAMELTFEADRDLRSARPDDRIVMEQFILRLTDGTPLTR